MANPQPKPFVQFSKELFDAFYQNPPETVAACVLWLWVLRSSYGDFGKMEAPDFSIIKIAHEVGLGKTTVHRTLQSLVRCRRLKHGDNGGYAVQKDYDLWQKDPCPRQDNWGNRAYQTKLFTPVDKSVDNSENVPHVGKKASPRWGNIRPHVGEKVVPTLGTGIRSKTTETFEKERGDDPRSSKKVLPNGKKDTPTERAELGDWTLAPQDHPGFTRLSFKIQDDIAKRWREVAEAKTKASSCRRGCGRPRASEAWPYCRPCTSCSVCEQQADGVRRFTAVQNTITCNDCKEKK